MKYGHFGQVGRSEARRRKLREIKGRNWGRRTNIGKPLVDVTYKQLGMPGNDD